MFFPVDCEGRVEGMVEFCEKGGAVSAFGMEEEKVANIAVVVGIQVSSLIHIWLVVLMRLKNALSRFNS